LFVLDYFVRSLIFTVLSLCWHFKCWECGLLTVCIRHTCASVTCSSFSVTASLRVLRSWSHLSMMLAKYSSWG